MNPALKLLITIQINLVFFSSQVFCQVDYGFQAVARSFPQGAAVIAKAGYSFPIYQVDKKVLYGYVRPGIILQSSAVVNSALAKIDFNPISFLNIYYGQGQTDRNLNKFHTFNCAEVICDSKVKREYYGARLALKYKSVFFLASRAYTENTLRKHSSGRYIDEIATLVHNSIESTLIQDELVLGFELKESVALGYSGTFSQVKSSGEQSRMHMLFTNLKSSEELNTTIGAGIFRTRFGAKVGTLVGSVSWTPKKGLVLF